ncbi:MAG: hypothetical protein HYX25_10815 [Candidatus Solibacter usitatus]|nr:hypothetical protein [Candidatus Solibacter usitatus]
MSRSVAIICALFLLDVVSPRLARGQAADPLAQILERLERLEKENHDLAEEVRALRRDLAVARPDPGQRLTEVEEKAAIQESRVEEQAQSKVESSQHLPIRLFGMALFNTFLNSRQTGGVESPVVAPYNGGALSGGATLRQSQIGLDYRGAQTLWGGQVHGSVLMDFFSGSIVGYESYVRLRTARMDVDWGSTSLMVGQDKPIISPREPNSLASVGYPALSDAGNLWRWQPQVRLEQRFRLSNDSGVRAQMGVFVTDEAYSYASPGAALQPHRPALQGRLEFWHRFADDGRRIAIAPGFHTSTTHVAGTTVPSSLFSLDWIAGPWSKLEFSGAFFTGRNIANLGGLYQGFTVLGRGNVIPVHSKGGWAQLSYLATPRLSFNLYSGQQDNRDRDLFYTGIGRNLSYAGNMMYRLAPNVIISLESGQVRTLYLGRGTQLNNRYDLAIAYLF